MPVLRCSAAAVVVLAMCAPALAQAAGDARGTVALKIGSMHEEAEDGLRQSSAALALSGAWRFSPLWMLDAEIADNGAGSPAHRETLVSVSAVRSFRERGVRPHLALGLTFGRNTEARTTCFADRVLSGETAPVRAVVGCEEPGVDLRVPERFASLDSYVLVGGGIAVPVSRRIQLVPELRIHLAVTAVILRPSLGLAIAF